MPPAAACSFIFANASHGQGSGWRLKPTPIEVVMVNPAPCSPWPPGDNLDKSCCFKGVPPKTKGTKKSQNKLKLSWKNETWRNSMSKSFQSQPIPFETYRLSDLLRFQVICQETRPCFFWHLTMWLMRSGCQTFHLELMSTCERLTRCFSFPKLKHIMDPVLSYFFQFSFRSQIRCFEIIHASIQWVQCTDALFSGRSGVRLSEISWTTCPTQDRKSMKESSVIFPNHFCILLPRIIWLQFCTNQSSSQNFHNPKFHPHVSLFFIGSNPNSKWGGTFPA